MSRNKLFRKRVKPPPPPKPDPPPQGLPASAVWRADSIAALTTAEEVAAVIVRRYGLKGATHEMLVAARPPRARARERALWVAAERLIATQRETLG